MDTIELRAKQVELNEQRLKAWEEGKRLLADTGGQFNAEQRAEWDRINAAIKEYDAQRDVLTEAETREREAGELREANMRVFGENAVVKAEQNEADQLRAWLVALKEGRAAPYQLDVNRGGHQIRLMRDGMSADEARALAWDTGSIASGVPTTTASQLYQKLASSIAAFKMPFTRIATSSGEQMKFPKVNAHGIATQVSGQGTTLAGTDPTFLSTTLDAYRYGQLVIVATDVVTDTSFDIVDFVTGNIARALGRVIDTDIIAGTGSGQPQGVMTGITGSGTVASGGTIVTDGGNGIPTYGKYIDLIHSVADEYRSSGACAWLVNDLTAGQMRKLRDGAGGTTGAVMWLPSLTAGIQGGQPDRFLGYPVYTDPNVASLASNSVSYAFGDWMGYYFRTVGNVSLESDNSRYFDTDQIGFRGKWRVDGDYVDTSAVNIMKISVS